MIETEIREGIAAYEDMQYEIREFLADGEKSSDEFDERFSALNALTTAAVRYVTPATFVLPPGGRQQEYLFVLQHMVRLGDVEHRTDGVRAFYRLPSGDA